MTTMFRFLFLPLFSGCLSAIAQGTGFTYQGRLNDGGSPATGIYDLRFTIYDAGTNGSAVGGMITSAATPVSNGLFTVRLDFGGSVFKGDARWLELAVRTNGSAAPFEVMAPRQELTPAPYALHSASAGSAQSVAATNLVGTIPSINIGAGTITSSMLAGGAVGAGQLAAGAVTTAALADGAVTGAKILSSGQLLSTVTLTNPTPFASDQFGFALAVVEGDKILVGAHLDDTGANNAGAAHLFDASGNLLTTLTNPTPAADDNFGQAVAVVGGDRLLIGAPQDDAGALNAGSAHLFSAGGGLLLTITNPSPSVADIFGSAVAAVGEDRFLIGSARDNPGGGQFGAAYLYDLAGNLVQIFTNPTPAHLDLFGGAVAAVGTGKVLIGARGDGAGAGGAGAAHLFGTNGALLNTITNPTPGTNDAFGTAVAAVGMDKLLIGAPSDDTGATDAGAAYLFDLDGNLLATFLNPSPATGDNFGASVAAVGNDRLLIAARNDDTSAVNAGAAYVFDLSGRLLFVVTNPAPAASDQFGAAVAALDAHHLVIGATFGDLGATDAGSVFVLGFDVFTTGLAAERVRYGAVNTEALAAAAVTAAKMADASVLSSSIANGTVLAEDLSASLLSHTFWRVDGNAGTSSSSNFIGTTDAQPLVLRANNLNVLQMSPGDLGPRLLVGHRNSMATNSLNSSIFGGTTNRIQSAAINSTILGGINNDIDETANSSILGGEGNGLSSQATNCTIVGGKDNGMFSLQLNCFIGAGANNQIFKDNQNAVIVGGRDNAIGTNCVSTSVLGGAQNVIADNVDCGIILGGFNNDIDGSRSGFNRQLMPIILGGNFNTIDRGGDYAIILGGSWNYIYTNVNYGVIAGGNHNEIGYNSDSGVIVGGERNEIGNNAPFAFAAGRRAKANHPGTFVWADSQDTNFTSSASNTFLIRASGGVGIGETSPGAALDVRQNTNRVAIFNRTGDDGVLVNWQRDGSNVGSVSVAAGVVSYNAFTGSHYAWTEEALERGLLVSLTGDNRRQAGPDSEVIYGVILTRTPNDPRCLGAYLAPEEPNRPGGPANPHQVMAVGNGELWVTDEGGDINPGDYLISSGTPGCAMKDSPARFPVGHICARSASRVNWAGVPPDAQGVRRQKISVLFDSFQRDSRTALSPELQAQWRQNEAKLELQQRQIAELLRRLGALEAKLQALEAR